VGVRVIDNETVSSAGQVFEMAAKQQ